MKKLYWITTGLAAVAFVFGGLADLTASSDMKAALEHLGYPGYLFVLLGAWKLAGGLAIAAPRLPRLKEWAYAGMVFDLTGAVFSHAWSGVDRSHIGLALVLLVIVGASWALRPADRKLEAAAATPAPIPAITPLRAAA